VSAALAPAPALDAADRFDGAIFWMTLPPEQQAEIGAAALDLVAAWACKDDAEERDVKALFRAGRMAEWLSSGQLMRAVRAAVPDGQSRTVSGAPRLPAALGMVCEACGCSENDACPGPCGWARDFLCTGCADKVAHV
jgi:hypothetical protein